MAWALILEQPNQPAQYLRSLIFSHPAAIDATEDADAALVYFHRRRAANVIRDHLHAGGSQPWRVVPIFVAN